MASIGAWSRTLSERSRTWTITNSQTQFEAALEACAREPIHAPGAVQPFGVLLVLDADMQRVVQISANTAELFDLTPETALTASPAALLGDAAVTRLRAALAAATDPAEPVSFECAASGKAHRTGRTFISAWQDEGCILIELEPVGTPRSGSKWLTRVNAALHDVECADSRDAVLARLVRAVRKFTGHDRVMAYAFDADWHGTVVAESRVTAAASYLGLHFPASDIPPPARAMYANNPLRIIPDVDATPAPLLPQVNPVSRQALNLGRGLLRGVSPIHLQYLRNMNVGASLSIRIRKDGELWGLIACHSHAARHVSPAAREAALAVVAGATNRMFTLLAEAEQGFRLRARELRRSMTVAADTSDDIHEICSRHASSLLSLFSACGVALVRDARITRLGRLPADDTIPRMVDALAAMDTRGPWSADHVDAMPVAVAAECASGLMAIPLGLGARTEWLLIFRPEQQETVHWAGDPGKPVEHDDNGLHISPRQSFETWLDIRRGRAQPWTDLDLEAAREVAHELAIIASASEIRALNARLREEQDALEQANTALEKLAETDSMTGIWNRYRMEQAIEEARQRAERYGDVFSLILLDIDRFKQVNDRHGHVAGDDCLRSVAAVIGQQVRGADRLARWGGEEFVVLVTRADEAGALEIAERLRAAVEAAPMPDGVDAVTISLGVSQWQPGVTLDSLFRGADRALYAAKEQGRNRVRAATAADDAY